MTQKLKIFIDPLIKDRYGPEICWTWRLLLTCIGYSWEEVHPDSLDCDIAYVTDLKRYEKTKLRVIADPNLWDQRSNFRLENVGSSDGLSYPIFDGNNSPASAFSVINGRILCKKDIIFYVFWLVTGKEEKFWSKNKHGFFDLSGTGYLKNQVTRLALASDIGSWLEKKLLKLGFPSPISRWPGNKRAAACLSHDVDYPEVKRLIEPLRIIHRRGLSGIPTALDIILGKKTHWHFHSWIQMEKKLDLRSAFYFVAVRGSLLKYAFGVPDPFYDIKSEKFRNLFRYLTDMGCEIGLHASYLAFESKENFANERYVLRQNTGQDICGNRHHYWHLNPENVESTLLIHEEIGLKYDTSLTHDKYLGWRRSLSWPFFPFHQEERRELKTLQIQTTWMDDQLFGYVKNNPGDHFEILQALTKTAAEQGGCLLINIHDYVFDEVLYPGWSKTYFWLMEHILDRSDFWIATPGEIAEYWVKRYRSILDSSNGLREGL